MIYFHGMLDIYMWSMLEDKHGFMFVRNLYYIANVKNAIVNDSIANNMNSHRHGSYGGSNNVRLLSA